MYNVIVYIYNIHILLYKFCQFTIINFFSNFIWGYCIPNLNFTLSQILAYKLFIRLVNIEFFWFCNISLLVCYCCLLFYYNITKTALFNFSVI